jgi:nucleotide-binding universal stress UspA family protein
METASMYSKILVPIDGSPTATRGLQEAVRLAGELGGHIRLVHIINEWIIGSPEGAAVNIGLVVDELRASGRAALHAAEEIVRDAGVSSDSVLLEEIGNQAGPAIVRQAMEWPAGLIVCGTHGRRGLRRIVMGSDAEYIVRRASVPVLLVRDDDVG